MSCPRIGDHVRYTHAHKSGTGMVVKIWRKRFYVGWNVLDDQTQKVVVGVPSYGLELLERARIKQPPGPAPGEPLSDRQGKPVEDPRLKAELEAFRSLSKALTKANERS